MDEGGLTKAQASSNLVGTSITKGSLKKAPPFEGGDGGLILPQLGNRGGTAGLTFLEEQTRWAQA